MSFDANVLANNLKKYRMAKNITQQFLADKLRVSPQSVSKWECAQAVPEIGKLCALAEILDVGLEMLLYNHPTYGRVLVGVDGGSTKTEFILFREDGTLLKRVVLPGANPNLHGLENSLSIFQQGLDSLLETGMELAGMYIGCAGFLSGGYGEKALKTLQKKYPRARVDCSSDVMNIIACGSNSRRCIAAICGTGSVIYANANREVHRLGGASYLLDKQGSGFDIGRDVLRTALLERDGVGEKSIITAMVEEKLGSTVWDAIHQIYQEGPAYIASFAPIAFVAYEQGDKVAARILREHAGYLADMIQAAAKMYDCGKTVVLAGSIFSKVPAFLQLLKEQVTMDLRFEVPAAPPVYGACVLARELCGMEPISEEEFVRQYAEVSLC